MSRQNRISEIKKRISISNKEPWYCTKKINDCTYNDDIPISDILEKKCHKYYTDNNDIVNPCRNTKFPEISRACVSSTWRSNKTLNNMCRDRVSQNKKFTIKRSNSRRSNSRRSSSRRSSSKRSSSRRFSSLLKQHKNAFDRMNNR